MNWVNCYIISKTLHIPANVYISLLNLHSVWKLSPHVAYLSDQRVGTIAPAAQIFRTWATLSPDVRKNPVTPLINVGDNIAVYPKDLVVLNHVQQQIREGESTIIVRKVITITLTLTEICTLSNGRTGRQEILLYIYIIIFYERWRDWGVCAKSVSVSVIVSGVSREVIS